VTIYATGAGQLMPSTPDGKITGSDLSRPQAAVSVQISGITTEVLYAGTAPQFGQRSPADQCSHAGWRTHRQHSAVDRKDRK
jgi:hypothetical protein